MPEGEDRPFDQEAGITSAEETEANDAQIGVFEPGRYEVLISGEDGENVRHVVEVTKVTRVRVQAIEEIPAEAAEHDLGLDEEDPIEAKAGNA